MLVMGLGDKISADILRQLEPAEIRHISLEIAALEAVAPGQMVQVFHEFEALASTSSLFAKGGARCARRLLENALGPETAAQILEPAETAPKEAPTETALLHDADPKQLAAFLQKETPQVIALVLSNMSAAHGGAVLAILPERLQHQVAFRILSMDSVSPEVTRKVTAAIGAKLHGTRQTHRPDGVRSLAALLNNIEAPVAEAILAKLEEENQQIGASVRNQMFVFEDILQLDKEAMKILLAQLDRKILTTALKGTSSEIQRHFTQNMSQRASEMLTEDMEALGAVRIREVQAAQQQVIAALRKLQQQGAITIGRGEEYVV